MVVEAALLLHQEQFGLIEGLDVHLGHVIVEIIVVDLDDRFVLKIDDVDFAFWDIENDHFLVVHHPEEINDVLVLIFPEEFSLGVEVDDALLLSWVVHSHAHEGLIVSA